MNHYPRHKRWRLDPETFDRLAAERTIKAGRVNQFHRDSGKRSEGDFPAAPDMTETFANINRPELEPTPALPGALFLASAFRIHETLSFQSLRKPRQPV